MIAEKIIEGKTVEELIDQYEPKVHKLLQTNFVDGMHYDEIAQELRTEIFRAHKFFDPDRGSKFHTVLHRFMIFRLSYLQGKAKRRFGLVQYVTEVPDGVEDDDQGRELREIISSLELRTGEKILLDMLLCGYKKTEIKRICVEPKSFDKVLKSLKLKARGVLTIE